MAAKELTQQFNINQEHVQSSPQGSKLVTVVIVIKAFQYKEQTLVW